MKKGISIFILLLILIGAGYLIFQYRTAVRSCVEEIGKRITKSEETEKMISPEPRETIAVSEYESSSPDEGVSNSWGDLRGKIVLLDFLATWCPPCHRAIPFIAEIYNDYKQRGLMVIGISLDTDSSGLRTYIKENEIPYPVIIADEEIKSKFEIRAIPTMLLYDQDGNLVLKKVGFNPQNIREIREKIEELLDLRKSTTGKTGDVGPVEINYFGQTIILEPISIPDLPQIYDPDQCYDIDWQQASEGFLNSIRSMFRRLKIEDCPFSQLLFLIELFSTFTQTEEEGYHSILETLSRQAGNDLSSVIATSVVMQKLGWDIRVFYNEQNAYLGVNLASEWKVRGGFWMEEDGRKYFLKEFDTKTPIGLKRTGKRIESFYHIKTKMTDLRPIPVIRGLPDFSGRTHHRDLKWCYQGNDYRISINIPFEQFHFGENLPIALYGMVFSGCQELKNIGLVDTLKVLVRNMAEYEQVNFLLKFCQSEDVFKYVAEPPLKSVSWQLYEGKDDCDGRSIFLYSLLHAVLNYPFEDIIFVEWPSHMALALRPKTSQAKKILSRRGVRIGDYYILDPTYVGDTYWGDKMPDLLDECQVIRFE